MASMVAKSCSSTSRIITVQEYLSRNKRKFQADPPLADSNKIIPLPPNESAGFEFSAEKFEGHSNGCDMCGVNLESPVSLKFNLGLSSLVKSEPNGPRDKIETSSDDSHDADWSDFTESQLEELVLSNLDTIFRSAVKKIIASGYSEEVATRAILRSGLLYGCKDPLSNIVENTLAFLENDFDFDRPREHYFEDLDQMKKYILAELVCLLREVRPFFSTGDAMWCLLISDMNMSHACAMDSGDASSIGNFSISGSIKEPKSSESNNQIPCRKSISTSNCLQTKAPNVANEPHLNPRTSFLLDGVLSEKESQNAVTNCINENPFKVAGICNTSSRKATGITKRDYILRQKSLHFEKHYRANGSKGASRAGKLSNFGGLVLDKKLKAVADSTGVNSKNHSLCLNTETPVPLFNSETISAIPPLPKSRISSPLPVVPFTTNPMPIRYVESSPDEKKDQMIQNLVPKVTELQNQLQEWTEWANQKVMQAARRLSKDKSELKTLKLEKEEAERIKKEKQALEENTVKKLSEMENALFKASRQVERANLAARRLGVENSGLRREMEAAKGREEELTTSCQVAAKREKETVAKFRAWEKEKAILQEEFGDEKQRFMQVKERLEKAKDLKEQVEARLNQETNANAELLARANSIKKERENIEISAKSKQDIIISDAENNLQKYQDDIKILEKKISELRLKKDSSKIAALRRGIYGSYANKLTDFGKNPTLKDSTKSRVSIKVKSRNFLEDFSGVKRERECVMCLSEEISVIFLPCAHQVVCSVCNELHEKQGMKDCPSCRSTIQRRVAVRYARS